MRWCRRCERTNKKYRSYSSHRAIVDAAGCKKLPVNVLEFGLQLNGHHFAGDPARFVEMGMDHAPENDPHATSAERQPWTDAIERVGSDDGDGQNWRSRSIGHNTGPFLDRAAAQYRFLSMSDAPFGEDADDSTSSDAGDCGADCANARTLPIDGKPIKCVNRAGNQTVAEKFYPRHEIDFSIDQSADDERFEMAQMAARQDETAGNLKTFLMNHDGLDAAKMDKPGDEFARAVKQSHSNASIATKAGSHQGLGIPLAHRCEMAKIGCRLGFLPFAFPCVFDIRD